MVILSSQDTEFSVSSNESCYTTVKHLPCLVFLVFFKEMQLNIPSLGGGKKNGPWGDM